MHQERSRSLIILTLCCTIMVFSGSFAVSSLAQIYGSPTFVPLDIDLTLPYPAEEEVAAFKKAGPSDATPVDQSGIYRFRGPFDITHSIVDYDRIVNTTLERDTRLALGAPGTPPVRIIEASDATSMRPESRVLGVVVNEQPRAYPIAILNWHGNVNDTLGGEPIAVTWCALSSSGRALGRIVQGEVLSFGMSGRLLDSNILLYDHQTMSLWSQALSQAVAGTFAGVDLAPIATLQTSWEHWVTLHPNTTVLDFDTGHKRDYSIDPYKAKIFRYQTTAEILYPVNRLNQKAGRDVPPKALTLGVTLNGVSKAYPFSELARSPRQFNDTVGGVKIVITFNRQSQTALATNIVGDPVDSRVSFWYSWINFHPTSLLYNAKNPLHPIHLSLQRSNDS